MWPKYEKCVSISFFFPFLKYCFSKCLRNHLMRAYKLFCDMRGLILYIYIYPFPLPTPLKLRLKQVNGSKKILSFPLTITNLWWHSTRKYDLFRHDLNAVLKYGTVMVWKCMQNKHTNIQIPKKYSFVNKNEKPWGFYIIFLSKCHASVCQLSKSHMKILPNTHLIFIGLNFDILIQTMSKNNTKKTYLLLLQPLGFRQDLLASSMFHRKTCPDMMTAVH